LPRWHCGLAFRARLARAVSRIILLGSFGRELPQQGVIVHRRELCAIRDGVGLRSLPLLIFDI
jgi:hypothetical protein